MSTLPTSGPLRVAHLMRRPLPGYFSIEGQFELVRRFLPPRYQCETWVCPRFSRGIWPRLRNARAAARVSADVWHVTGDVHYLTYHLPKARTLLTVHDCVFLHQTSGLRRWLIKKMFYDWAVPRAAIVTVISQATRRELLSLVPEVEPSVRQVPCCVSPEFAKALDRPWPETPEVLMVGTKPNKNLVRMVQALAGLRCRLHIVGEQDADLRAALAASNLPWRNSPSLTAHDMAQAYRDCDLLAFASTYEGFGLPIIEAQATGRPVLTSDAASMPEASGGAALLVNPFEVASMAAGFRRLLEDSMLRADLVRRGLENAALYAAPRVARMYADIYDELSSLDSSTS